VRDGIVAGKSLRQIARDLDLDEGTIRRDRNKLLLPAEELAIIMTGAEYEPIKNSLKRRKEEAERQRRAAACARRRAEGLANEEKLGTLSNALRDSLLGFLDSFNFDLQTQHNILVGVEKKSWFAGTLSEDLHVGDHQIAIEVQKPPVTGSIDRDCFVKWLYMWLYRAEPKQLIRDCAIVKARRVLESQGAV
jgi:hypothetical protein